MGLGHTTLTIDRDLIEEAKNRGINISRLLQDVLKTELQSKELDVLEEVLKNLQLRDEEIHSTITKLLSRIGKLKEKEKVLNDFFTSLPELKGVADYSHDFVSKIAVFIHQKYPSHPHFDLSDVRKFILSELKR